MGKTNFKSDKTSEVETKTGVGTDVKVDAPESRMQTEQVVEPVAASKTVETPKTDYVPKAAKASGSSLKQEVASSIITGKGFGGVTTDVASANAMGLKTIGYSGNNDTISGSAAGTPAAGSSYQGHGRVGMKLSDPNKDINFLANEQVLVEHQHIPALAENPSSEIGFVGTPRNASVRMQKSNGGSSAEDGFERSLDYLIDDTLVFTAGQTVKQKNVTYLDYPTTTLKNGEYEKETVDGKKIKAKGWHTESFTATRGNFSPRAIKVKLKKDSESTPAYVSSFSVDEDDLSCNNEAASTVNKASTAEKRFLNKVEITRQTIDNTCGSPTSDHFNPLGRSVAQPTQTLGYLKDIESSTGATIYACIKSALKSKAYYLNRTMKDGQDITGPAIDALYGHLMKACSSEEQKKAFAVNQRTGASAGSFYNEQGMLAGSSALLIALYDSMGKFNNKADVVTQSRGLKMHIQTGLNSMEPFHVDPDFVKAYNSVDVFSTIDRGYDAMNSICVTDGVRLVYPYSWNSRFNFTRASAGADRVYGSTLFVYDYQAQYGMNKYTIKVTDPLLAGLAYYFELNCDKLYSVLNRSSSATGEITLTIPTTHYGMHFGLFDYLVCAALPYIVYERTNSMKDILDYEVNYGYPFKDLVTMKEANPESATNYSGLGSMTNLNVSTMTENTAYRWRFPETPIKMAEGALTMLPWYFSSAEFDITQGSDTDDLGTLKCNGEHAFTTFDIRSGVTLSSLDSFFNADLEDRLLGLDRMVRIPYVSAINANTAVNATYQGVIYKYSQDGDGIPCLSTKAISDNITLADYYSTPRQIGWILPGYTGCTGFIPAAFESGKNPFIAPVAMSTLKAKDITPSIRAKMYKSVAAISNPKPTTLDANSVVVNRGQNFTQVWFMYYNDTLKGDGFDVLMSLRSLVSDYKKIFVTEESKDNYFIVSDNNARFTPFTNALIWDTAEGENIMTKNPICSLHSVFYSVIQKLPFAINPFDAKCSYDYVDPFTLAYMFGLCGFYAADYSEMDYNRINAIQQQAYGFTTDPYDSKTPILR